jgi:hypothetical protein
MEFVDPTGTGEFHLTMDPSEKDALLNVPGAGLTMPEQMGMADKSSRFSKTNSLGLRIMPKRSRRHRSNLRTWRRM